MKTQNSFELFADKIVVRINLVCEKHEKDDKEKKAKECVLAEEEFMIDEIPATLLNGEDSVISLAAYGLSQKMQDNASSYTDKKFEEMGVAGLDSIAEQRMELYRDTFNLLKGGNWKAPRAASAARAATVDAFFAKAFAEFLSEQSGKAIDETTATTILQGRSKEEREAFRKHPDISARIAQAKRDAQEAAASIDLSALLG